MSQQIVIDSLSFAREGRSLQGELPVSGLERLHDVLAEIAGVVVFRLHGRMSRQAIPQSFRHRHQMPQQSPKTILAKQKQ